jgi:myosin heavy subunit
LRVKKSKYSRPDTLNKRLEFQDTIDLHGGFKKWKLIILENYPYCKCKEDALCKVNLWYNTLRPTPEPSKIHPLNKICKIKELEERNNELEESNKELEKINKALEEKNKELEERYKALEERNKESVKQIKDTEKKMKELEKKNKESERKMKELEKKNKESERKNKETEKRIKDAEKKIKDAEKQNKEFEKQNKELEKINKELEKMNKENEEKIKKYEEKNKELNNIVNEKIKQKPPENINLVELGHEKLCDVFTLKYQKFILSKKYKSLEYLISETNFNKKYQQFHNICITNIHNRIAYKYVDSKKCFITITKDVLYCELKMARLNDIIDFTNKCADILDENTKRIMNEFIDKMVNDDEYAENYCKDDIKNMIYNGSKINNISNLMKSYEVQET